MSRPDPRRAVPAALLLLAACAAPGGDETSRLQGVWAGPGFGGEGGVWTIAFDGESFSAQGPEPRLWYRGTIGLPGGGDPAWIDFRILECDCPYRGRVSPGIYEIDGNVLTLAAVEPHVERPSAFRLETGQVARLSRRAQRAGFD